MKKCICVLFMLLAGLGDAVYAAQLAFFYALEADAAALSARGQIVAPSIKVGSRNIQRLRLGPHTVYLTKMGSGCLETALSAQALLVRFRCDAAYSIGPAGALRDGLVPGTWYAVDRVRAWQKISDAGHTLAPCTNLAARANLLNTTSRLCVASGENFITSTEERARVHDISRADAVDMNLYGLILACEDHRVPLTAWKIISDLADESASDSFQAFRDAYNGAGGAALADLILALPPDPADPLTHPAIERALREQ